MVDSKRDDGAPSTPGEAADTSAKTPAMTAAGTLNDIPEKPGMPAASGREAATEEPTGADRSAPAPERRTSGDRRDDDPIPTAVRQRIEAFIPEMIKRTFAAGMGAVFTTEEGIRRVAKEMTLPKEVASYVSNTAGNTKDEIVRIIAREVRDFLQTINLSEEIAKMLTTLSFEVRTEIRFIPNDEKYGSVKPDVKAKVSLKRTDDRSNRKRRRRRGRSSDSSSDDGDE